MYRYVDGNMVYWFSDENDYNMALNLQSKIHKLQLSHIAVDTKENKIIKNRIVNVIDLVDKYMRDIDDEMESGNF